MASNYLNLAADRERLSLARETLKSQESSYRLIQSRHEAGVSSALISTGPAPAWIPRVWDVARYTTLVAQDENALNLVVGSAVPAEFLPAALSDTLTPLKDLSPGLRPTFC